MGVVGSDQAQSPTPPADSGSSGSSGAALGEGPVALPAPAPGQGGRAWLRRVTRRHSERPGRCVWESWPAGRLCYGGPRSRSQALDRLQTGRSPELRFQKVLASAALPPGTLSHLAPSLPVLRCPCWENQRMALPSGGRFRDHGLPLRTASVTRPASPSLQTPRPPPRASSWCLVAPGGGVPDPHGSHDVLAVTPREEANLG